jgi:hypothetical protein
MPLAMSKIPQETPEKMKANHVIFQPVRTTMSFSVSNSQCTPSSLLLLEALNKILNFN